MSWQQIAMIVWIALDLGIGLVLDGTPRQGKHQFLPTLVTSAIMAAILYTGGFWR